MMRALAVRGCRAAQLGLRRVLRREEDGDTLQTILGWYLKNGARWPSLGPRDYDRFLVVLPSTAEEMIDRIIRLGSPEGAPARLKVHVQKTAYRHFDQLSFQNKKIELLNRFETLSKGPASLIDWEVHFSQLTGEANLSRPRVSRNDPLSKEAVLLFFDIVERFSRRLIRKPSPALWAMHYESAVLKPLALTYAFKGLGRRARRAYGMFLRALERPVERDFARIACPDHLADCESPGLGFLMRKEMEMRLATTKAFRKGPHTEVLDDGAVQVDLLDPDSRLTLSTQRSEITRLRSLLSLSGTLGPPGATKPYILSLAARWSEVPLL